jgi:hypothetical protein
MSIIRENTVNVDPVTARKLASDARLAAAQAAEHAAKKLRRDGELEEAAEAFDAAAQLYVDADIPTEANSRNVKRCRQMASNLRYPRKQRAVATTPRPNCLTCKKPLRRFTLDGRTFADGTPREWGNYGDHRFCGLTCGWRWACANSIRTQEKL